MLRVGIIGFGGMGKMHLGIYNRLRGVEVKAVADIEAKRLRTGASEQKINIGTGGGTLDPKRTRLYDVPTELIKDKDIDIVDICTPTCTHAGYAVKALKAGKNVLSEKPMALNYADCMKVVTAAKKSGRHYMTAQCIRFWPEYVYLADTIRKGRLGRLKCLSLVRVTPPPLWAWKNWFAKPKMSGGGILDLHVHDVDFLVFALGKPKAVESQGTIGFSGSYDVVTTLYDYGPRTIVSAVGNMSLPAGASFKMAYSAMFEKGMIDYDCTRAVPLVEFRGSKQYQPKVKTGDGYFHEIDYYVKCVAQDKKIEVCRPESSALSIKVAMAERKACKTGKEVKIS